MHQSELLVLDHGLMPLGHFFVVFEVDELFEGAQVLVQVSFDFCLSNRKVKFVFVVQFGKAEISFYLVDGLFD